MTAREVALDTLVKVAEAGAYSNLQLNRALQDAELSRQDAGLATELVYGTIQHQRTLDDTLEADCERLHKLTPWVHSLLRMSAYQLLYLDRIPPHAAVNEAVDRETPGPYRYFRHGEWRASQHGATAAELKLPE